MPNNNPWLGLKTYSEGQILYGRSEEINALSQDIIFNRQTVVYGKSGIGKSSLLNAGVFPILRRSKMFPVNVRLVHNDKQTNYNKQITNSIEDSLHNLRRDIVGSDGRTHTLSELIGTKTELCRAVTNENGESLWEFFHRHKFFDDQGMEIQPVIVFDQFEEIFTLCKEEKIRRAFFDQLADLINDVPPSYIYASTTSNEDDEIVEVIDDNEDLFIVEDDVIEQTYNYSHESNFHIVLTIREDFLSYLERYTTNIPSLKHNRYCLRPLSDDQAGIIISDPVPGLISEDVAIDIICKITDTNPDKFKLGDGIAQLEVDSAILSLFLSELYKKKSSEDNTISKELVQAIGDNIITSFYEKTMSGVSEKSAEYIERRLVTDDGRRDSIFEDRALSRGVTKEELKYLKDERLIHEFPWNDDGMRIEFMHDILCPVIVERRKRREQKRLQEEEAQKIRHEEEKKRKLLQEEQERERTKRNIEYNQKKRATERNVLIHKGRRLVDNALDFGEFRTINGITMQNPVDKSMVYVRLMTREFGDFFEDSSDSEFVNQQVFSDPLLNNSDIILSFFKDDESAPTIDGIYGVELRYEGSLISDIFFMGKRVLSDGSLSFDEPTYIMGGYSGIHIDYDENKREIQRTYLDDLRNPIITLDGYSVIRTEYDDKDNPSKVRYYILNNGNLTPTRHLHGNHGYNSVFDKNGNEIERHFVDENELPITIVSGVFGKRMTYEKETFRLLTISNIDSKGNLMADKDGYVTDSKIYDEKGLPTLDYYLDEDGKPWRNPNGIYGVMDKIDSINNVIEVYNVDENGSYVEDKDGVLKIVTKINEKRQITELYSVDKNNNIIESEDNRAIQIWEFDEQNRLQSIKNLNKKRQFVSGKRFESNKEGTHIIREFYLSENGIGKNEDFDVEGIEYSLDEDRDLPVLQIFINENKQYKKSRDGYYAIRNWEDEEERTVKQLYYHVDGSPMANYDGEYGAIVDYLDEETTKITHIDPNGNMIENNNGVAFTIRKESSSGIIETNYNYEGKPHANNDLVYYYKDRKSTLDGYIEKTYVHNSKNELIVFCQPRLADSEWEPIKCMFTEITYDEKGRPLSQYFKDVNGQNVGDSVGDSYTIWDYDDRNCIEIRSLYNTNDELKQRMRTKRDEKGRVLEQAYLNEDNSYAELERGYSGQVCVYNDVEGWKSVTCIDNNGNVCNGKEGCARYIYKYDQFGRVIAQETLTADDVAHCKSGICLFIDYGRKEGSRYFYRRDGQGNIIPHDNGSVYKYSEERTDGRTSLELYLDGNKEAIPDEDGDYGLSYEYYDDKRLTIIKCLGENGEPHNNKLGYGIIKSYKNEEGKDIRDLYFTIEGVPTSLSSLLGCYGRCYEYPNDYNKIVGFLNEKGEITTNSHGYAYREECLNPETGLRRVFYYDESRNNTQSLEDETKEYGYAIDYDGNWRYIISLGKDGQISNNAAGYARRAELYDDGELCFYKYIDADAKPIADDVGDYGTEIMRSDDGSMVRYVSLNAKYEHHLNDYGYCFRDVITDIGGDKIKLFRDIDGNQVLPKLRLTKRIKKLISRSKKKEKIKPVLNCRQIGAISNCFLGIVEGNELEKKYGLCGTYILLQYDNWKFKDDSEKLEKIISLANNQSNHLVLLPVILNGSLLQKVDEIINLDFPAGQKGMRFMDWGINMDTLNIIYEKEKQYENS